MLLFQLMFLFKFKVVLAVVEISCSFRNEYPNYYTCLILTPAIITPNERVVSVSGGHKTNYTNSKVNSVSILNAHYLPRGLSAFFQNLERVETGGSGLKEISRADFSDLRKLKNLELAGNELTQIPGDAFQDLTELEYLDLKTNKIVTLPDNLLFNQIHLNVLNLAHNKLQSFTNTLIENCPMLDSFTLYNNDIRMISPDLILKLPHLKDQYSVSHPCHVSFDDPNFVDSINKHCNRNCAYLIENVEYFRGERESCNVKLSKAIKENKMLRTEEKTCIMH